MDLPHKEYVKLDGLSEPESMVEARILNKNQSQVIMSTIPSICKIQECIVGIDEAGRGPVLGPMVYGICFCLKTEQGILEDLGCADSKTLTEGKRETIFAKMCSRMKYCGWAVEILSPNIISNRMLRRHKYSLNETSHQSARELIQLLLDVGVKVSDVFIDTVGTAETYKDKMSQIFPSIEFVVEKKADSKFPIVSAASICAKVIRDWALRNWKFPEYIAADAEWGSGYPGDPLTKTFLLKNIDSVFGYPRVVRFSWSTADQILSDTAIPIYWSDDEDDENMDQGNPQITSFFNQISKSSRHVYFSNRNLRIVDNL